MNAFTTTLVLILAAQAQANAPPSAYDRAVLADQPTLYLSLSHAQSGNEPDLTGHGYGATYLPAGSTPHSAQLPDGELAADFNGAGEYLEIGKVAPELSVPATGVISLEAWIRPDTLQFPNEEESGYVYWLGKGSGGQYEYAGRMYSITNTEDPPRPNRISGYEWNLDGGFGSGSYFEDPVKIGEWIHVAIVINMKVTSPDFPTGYVKIYKNGELRGTTALAQFQVAPGTGQAPLRVATRDFGSYFQGAVGKVALYDYEISSAQLARHLLHMK